MEVADLPEHGPERAAALGDVRRGLADALATLSPAHRAVVELTYYQEFSYAEIGAILGCRTETVKTRMFHARRNLRQVLTGESGDWI